MEWTKELGLAKDTAISAGQYLLKLYKKNKEVMSNNGKDIKLKADKESEEIIINRITEESKYPILSEEIGEYGLVDNTTPTWIVDPIDGTYNFSKGLPLCCVSIALWKGNQPILGVIYDFVNEQLYSGIVGKGAWCNDECIAVSDITKIEEASLATGFPVYRDYDSESLKIFLKQVQSYKKVRMFGSAAFSLAYVACGCVDVYYEENIMLWDVAAGIALVKAAGGYVEIEDSIKHKWARHVKCYSSESMAYNIN